MVKNPPANTRYMRDVSEFDPWEDPLEEEKATYCSILAWRLPWTCGLQSIGSQRVGHD